MPIRSRMDAPGPHRPPPPPPPPRRRRPLGRLGTLAAWALAVPALASSLAWTFSGADWRVDLVAAGGAQLLLACALIALACAALRRRWPLVTALAACALHAVPLTSGRAAWWPAPAAAPADPPAPGVVRFLHYNDSSRSDKADVDRLMRASGADVLSILCPPLKMQFEVIYGPGLEDRYPGKLTREWKAASDGLLTEVTAGFLVSRWPVGPVDLSCTGPLADRFIAGVVERPEGAFVVIAVHPRSPRTLRRWIEGNLVVEALARLAAQERAKGLPVVVLTDLNATPTAYRSRFLAAEAGLRRAKPLLDPSGTYPFQVTLDVPTDKTPVIARPDAWRARWPVALAIDDALVSPEIGVRGWTCGDPVGRSDHRPVRVDLFIPPPAPGASHPAAPAPPAPGKAPGATDEPNRSGR